jgi:hypothetical protein
MRRGTLISSFKAEAGEKSPAFFFGKMLELGQRLRGNA